MNEHPLPVSITISISELYKNVCPDCRERILDYISGKAAAGNLRDGLRRQLEAESSPATAQGPQDPPQP